MLNSITVGITTAPRKDCTLLECADRVVEVGFPEPIIFAEPDSTLTEYKTYHNQKTLGAWHNWKSMVKILLENHPSEHYLLMQDDAYFLHLDTASLLPELLYPKSAGFVSLYTPTQYAHGSCNRKKNPGVHHLQTETSLGALAMVFHRSVLEAMTKTRTFEIWIGKRPDFNVIAEFRQRTQNPTIVKHVDNAIGEMIKELNRTYWYVVPSLATHIAEHSCLGHGPNTNKRNAEYAVDPNCNLLTLIPSPETKEELDSEKVRSLREDGSSKRNKRDQVAWWGDSNLGD